MRCLFFEEDEEEGGGEVEEKVLCDIILLMDAGRATGRMGPSPSNNIEKGSGCHDDDDVRYS